jgi:hypothetical protein
MGPSVHLYIMHCLPPDEKCSDPEMIMFHFVFSACFIKPAIQRSEECQHIILEFCVFHQNLDFKGIRNVFHCPMHLEPQLNHS